jgi:predicted integral membrane protein DUF2275/putative zinc finger protein
MKCEEIQSHFSDYLDKTAEAPRVKGIENHLTNCPICSEEFAGLLQCRQLVSDLPEIEPPIGFTMRVMAHVADAANEQSLLWNRLFTPLKIKMSLQATAVVLVGILSFYVYKKADYEKPPAPTAPQHFAPAADKAIANAKGADRTVPLKEVEKPIAQTANPPEKKATARNAAPDIRPIPAVTVSDTPSQISPENRRSFPIQAQGVVAGSGMPGPIGIPRQRPFRLFPAESELVNLGEPTADYELLVRVGARRTREAEDTANSAEKSAKPESSSSGAAGGRLIDLPASSVLNILWYTVPQDQYEQFKKELAAQAQIESEVPIGIKDKASSFRSEGPLFIKVIVLAPSE